MMVTKTLDVTFFDFNHNMIALMFGIEECNRHQHMQAVIQRNRYWHDHQGQPRRNPTMRPLLHNGRKYRN